MLNCATHEVDGVLIITLEEGFDESADRGWSHRETVYKLVQSREDGRVAVDLGKLEFMSSADFGFLISLRRRIETRNGKLVLFGVDPFIRNTFATMKLLSLFTIADDLNAALICMAPVIG